MTQPLLVANWKMHKRAQDVAAYMAAFKSALQADTAAGVVLCPAFPHLAVARQALADGPVALGAQDLFWEPGEGAYTGEVSAQMLADLGVSHVIVGHSERRRILHESDAWVARKVRAAVQAGFTALLCVGEDEEERERGETGKVIDAQLEAALAPLTPAHRRRAVVAYEPLWAIGSGRPSRPQDAADVAAMIRAWLLARGGARHGPAVLYGGSVNAANVAAYVREEAIDGALVGGASLDPHGFARLVMAAAAAARPSHSGGERGHGG